MRHRIDHRKLNRTSKHRLAMLRNMASSLITVGRVVTTVAKAKEVRRFAEKAITIGKAAVAADKADAKLHYTRQAQSTLNDREAVAKLVGEVAGRYKDRNGGYTRIYRAGYRLGDHAEVAILELV
jgi:large subunit ribosomal protein L17